KEDAEKIWHEEKYENRTEELLALMQEFKFCYQNPTTKKYVVPSKLPSSADNLPVWDITDNVQLRLQYDWMPKAVAIQLLVSLHEYIATIADSEQWIWRKGAILDGQQLELEGVQVRILDEYPDKRISINARGPYSEILLRTIMKKWKEVNEPFKDKVKVTPIILCPCATCADLDTPHTFRYQSVLNAKQQKQRLQCNESFKSFKAEEILKGVYDETTVLVDSLQGRRNKHSNILSLVASDDLEEAIAAISSPEYNALFERRLVEWNRNSSLGMLSFEQKTQARSALAKDLVEYLTLDRWQEGKEIGQLKEVLPHHKETFNRNVKQENENSNKPSSKEASPSVKVIINNTPQNVFSTPPESAGAKTSTESESQSTLPKPVYTQWWFIRILGAIIGGGVVAYFAQKYADLNFGDTWLGVASLVATVLLMRNPKRVYLRWAGFCVMAIAGINILSQIDVAFNVTNTTEENRPWDLFFKLGFGEEPIISVILGILAAVLFVLDYRVRKERL
ncbi:MAG: COR domain-containing protein, partial [Cyanobacteria bacterium J06649_11]